jgi:hypothetical protein
MAYQDTVLPWSKGRFNFFQLLFRLFIGVALRCNPVGGVLPHQKSECIIVGRQE